MNIESIDMYKHVYIIHEYGAIRRSTFRKGGVQWKQGVVIYMTLYTSLLYSTTPIHCTPLRLHPPLVNTQPCRYRIVRVISIG